MIHVMGKSKDTKGIELKIVNNDVSKQIVVTVWKGEAVKTQAFAANRFGFFIADSFRALDIADALAEDIEQELKI